MLAMDLAQAGITGPESVFEGKFGFFETHLTPITGQLDFATGGAGFGARGVGTLIAPSHLKGTVRLGEPTYVDVFYVRAVDRERNLVFRLAGGRARVTADTARIVDDFGPLDGPWICFWPLFGG